MHDTTKVWSLLLGGLGMMALLPRCSCDDGPGIERAAVEMRLTYLEEDSCSGAMIPRRIPDDYQATSLTPATDFGSVGARFFEVRSVGSAPLKVESVSLSAEDSEFTLTLANASGEPVELPISIGANTDLNAAPGLVIHVQYASADNESDLVDLVVVTDDPQRAEVRFGLSAGRGRVEVCGTNGCGETAEIQFGDVTQGQEGEELLTIKNVGEGNLDLRSIKLESDSAEFCAHEATEIPEGIEDCQLIPQCMVIPPGASYTVRVRYRPIDGGVDMGNITIVSGDAAAGNVVVPINGRGAGPAVCPCLVENGNCNFATSVDFGVSDVGLGVAKTMRLESCGTQAVDITEVVLESDSSNPFFTGPQFSISGAFPTGTLQPGEYAEGEVTYTPDAAGTHRGGLRYTVSQTGLRSWVPLVGRAATCDLDVLPTGVGFGTVAGGSTAERPVLLANNGARNCTVTAITDPTNSFSIPNKPALPLTIAPGASQTVMVRFSPPPGPVLPYMSSFNVTSDEPGAGATTTVELTGQGGGTPVCEIRVSPSGNDLPTTMRDGRLQFGAVNIGYSKMLPVRVENIGNTDCILQSYNLVVQAATEFRAMPSMPLPATIAAGGSVALNVTFAPTRPAGGLFGTYGGLLNHIDFVVQGAGLTQNMWAISISGSPTQPTIDVIPGSVDFGIVTWERPQAPDNRSSCGSVTRNVNVYNSGTGDLHITGLMIDPSSDPVFLVTEVRQNNNRLNPPYNAITIAPGASIAIDLRFYPSRANPAEHQGLLIIDNDVTNAGGNGAPLTVPLRGESTINSQQTDVFQQLADNKVDILWVVDDSGSMSEEQQLLANNFGSFIAFADSLGVDYQVGVTTTEVNDANSGQLWSCNGYNRIIRSSDANRLAAFQCAANVTNPPGGNQRPNPGGSDEQEAGLQAARIALDVPVVNGTNAGFLRADARLAVIMVSDEEDQSDGSVNLYIDFFRNLKGFANPQLVSVSAIAGDVPGGCATAAAGPRYQAATQALGGQFSSICSSSWQQMLQNIGLGVFALRQAWSLSRPADPTTIVVRVNGVSVARNATNGWTFDSASNTLTFHGSSIPPPGATIEVQYGSLCLP